MSLIALTGAKSAGITTSALALAATWPGPLLLTECDPAGGDVAAGLLRGAEAGPGLLELALATRRGLTQDQFWEHTTALSGDGTLRLLAGLSDPAQHATLSPAWPLLTRMLRALSPLGSPAEGKPNDVDVLADCGRFAAGTPYGLLAAADLVLLVLRPTLSHVAHTRNRLADLQGQLAAHAGGPPPELGLLIVDAGPYPPNEVAAALGVAVAGVLANDAESAAVLAGLGESRARFEKSPLMRSAQTVAANLHRAARAATGPAVDTARVADGSANDTSCDLATPDLTMPDLAISDVAMPDLAGRP